MPKKTPHQLIALAFALIGVLLSYWACERGGAAWLMAWPAANCLAVGAAYYTVGGRIFGKQLDGKMRADAGLAMLPFLIVTWLTWHAQRLCSRRPAWAEAAPGLYFGRRAFERELPSSAAWIVDMTAEFAKPAYGADRNYFCLPTLDAFVPSDEDFLAAARMAATAEGPVYIHCANGHGRSATLAAAVLMLRGIVKNLTDAEKLLVAKRPGAAWHPAQRALLERLAPVLKP